MPPPISPSPSAPPPFEPLMFTDRSSFTDPSAVSSAQTTGDSTAGAFYNSDAFLVGAVSITVGVSCLLGICFVVLRRRKKRGTPADPTVAQDPFPGRGIVPAPPRQRRAP